MIDHGFDKRWEKHPAPQATTEKMFWSKTGWRPSALGGKTILDAGCGCGRFAAMAARSGALVTGVDVSPHAIAASQKNALGNFIVADLLSLNLGIQFDLAYSIGVLHHTGDTKKAFMNVAYHVKEGGEFAVWLYAQPATDELMPYVHMLHEITRAVPPETLHAICEKYSVQIRDLNKNKPYGPLQSVLQVSQSPDDEECISDTFDWHCPQHRDYYGEKEVRDWFKEAGFDVVWNGNFPTSMRGRKR